MRWKIMAIEPMSEEWVKMEEHTLYVGNNLDIEVRVKADQDTQAIYIALHPTKD